MVHINVTTEPPGAKIILISLDTRITRTYYSPTEISYDPGVCFKPKLIIEKPGYVGKVIHLVPDMLRDKYHIVLEMAAEGRDKLGERPQMGAPEQLDDSIKMWIPDIKAQTPAFDPSHQ